MEITKKNTYPHFDEIWTDALKDLQKYGDDFVPTPVTMSLGDSKETWDEGECGFVSINFRGNSAFSRWAKQKGLAHKNVPSGMYMNVSAFFKYNGQGMQRKKYVADELCRRLNEKGIIVSVHSQLL